MHYAVREKNVEIVDLLLSQININDSNIFIYIFSPHL